MQDQIYKVVGYSISYLMFFAFLWISKKKRANRFVDEQGITVNPNVVIMVHIAGILVFGLLPLFYASRVTPTNSIDFNKLPGRVTLLLSFVMLPVSLRIAERKYQEAIQNRPLNNTISNASLSLYFIVRILFICAYEAWFRGYLLSHSISYFGAPVAILLNIVLYSLLHTVNGRDEFWACIPFGLLLCGLCIWQGAAWPAMILHLTMTVPFEISFIRKLQLKQLQHANSDNRRSGILGQ
jgi:membrane protease YdiL (CAAX protease family)